MASKLPVPAIVSCNLIFAINFLRNYMALMVLIHAAAGCHAASAASNSISTGFTLTRIPADEDNFHSNLQPILTSPNARFSLLLTGCSLVVMRKPHPAPSLYQEQQEEKGLVVWLVHYRSCEGLQDESNTIQFKQDGDIVIYGTTAETSGAIQRWSSGTASKGARTLILSDKGILQLKDGTGAIVWQSSDDPYLVPPRDSSLEKNQRATSGEKHVREALHVQERTSTASLTSQHWYQNYSCIFDSTNSFSYLHVGYVYYFNISNRVSFQSPVDSCLDTCTQDCSCAAVVYNSDTQCCYEFHQYIPVQTLPFNPVQRGDILSVYIKVERGTYSRAPSQFSLHYSAITVLSPLVILLTALLVF